jgi:flagellar basal-body rod protein FlgG
MVTMNDVSSSNVANVSTVGFMRSRVNLVDVRGGGVSIGSVSRDFSPGPFLLSGRALDLAPTGQTFFALRGPNGRTQYTRDGAFRLDAGGTLTAADGTPVAGGIVVPPDSEGVEITSDGSVLSRVAGAVKLLGRIDLVQFSNADGLRAVGDNRFEATDASGPARPYLEGPPPVIPGELVGANTDLAARVVEAIASTMGIRVNVVVINVLDDLMGNLVSMKR